MFTISYPALSISSNLEIPVLLCSSSAFLHRCTHQMFQIKSQIAHIRLLMRTVTASLCLCVCACAHVFLYALVCLHVNFKGVLTPCSKCESMILLLAVIDHTTFWAAQICVCWFSTNKNDPPSLIRPILLSCSSLCLPVPLPVAALA